MSHEHTQPRSGSRLRWSLAGTAAAALAVGLLPIAALSGTSPAASAAPAASTSKAGSDLTPATFAEPPTSVKPMYRWWMPLAYTDDDELRQELRDMAAGGAGGVEIAPFIVPGTGHQTNAFLAQYGWGTPAWEHKLEVITDEAVKLGLQVDQNLGPAYPPTVPTLNSFNQPQAEQQLLYGREFTAAGGSRSGALPAPASGIPTVSTKLCAPASAGDDTLRVENLGGYAAGDTITVGAGAGAEKVTVTGLGDRTATCGELSVSPVSGAHAVPETVVNVARTTRIKTIVAQCAADCDASTAGTIALDPASVVDVSSQVSGGKLDYTFPAGNGKPWVLLNLVQTASGQIAQSGGYTMTQPNYVVDHWSTGGVQIQTNFWDDKILTDTVQSNLDKIGRGSIFEDSLELGSTQKWTSNLLQSFENLRGYDATLALPALLGTGLQGTGTPAFELAGIGPKLREDYRQTMSDLYTTKYVAPMQRWAQSHGLNFRVQSYGTPIASGDAAAAAGIAEGESLNFGSPNAVGAEQDYRVLAGGVHASGKNIVSTECCAAFTGNFRSSVAGPNVGGQFTDLAGKQQGLLDSIYKAYAGGVNQLVWHGYAYRDAPKGVGVAGRDGGTWPGYHPWDIYGALNVNDEFGPRQASWPDYAPVNDNLARTQLVLRQGRSTSDIAVYYQDKGLAGKSAGDQEPTQHLLGTGSATSSAGYTYEYLTPGILGKTTPDNDGHLFADGADYQALVLNQQSTLSPVNARRLLALAEEGLKIFVVGATPAGAEVADVVADLLAESTVTQVADETALPAALKAAGITPAVTPAEPSAALGLVRRETNRATYDFVYNRSASTVETDLTLTGSGTPYVLDTWTGKITPVASYVATKGGVKVHVRIAPYDKVILALASPAAGFGAAPGLHAVSSNGEVTAVAGANVTLRADENGTYTAALSNGTTRSSVVAGIGAPQALNTWSLQAQTWTPGVNEYTTTKTDQPAVAVTADEGGNLPSWLDIKGAVNLSASSGIGTYTTTVELPTTWTAADGAYLALGDVLDTATVTVNGTQVSVNQSDRGRIDLGRTLHVGTNTVVVRVATTMFNAVRTTGDSNYSGGAWQRTGLMGPVVLTPYREVTLKPAPVTPPVVVAQATRTQLTGPASVRSDKRARVTVAVTAAAREPGGVVRISIDGKVRATAALSGGKVRVLLPKLRAGKHRITAQYVGTSAFKPSGSSVLKMKVVKKR